MDAAQILAEAFGHPPTDWQIDVADRALHAVRNGTTLDMHLLRRTERAQAKHVLDSLSRAHESV